MQLRKEWKITAPPQNVNRYQPKFSVEFTYFNGKRYLPYIYKVLTAV